MPADVEPMLKFAKFRRTLAGALVTVLQAVTSVLATNNLIAADLRVEQANLDDAFVHLTRQKAAAVGAGN